jgi:6-phosphogluconolactonase
MEVKVAGDVATAATEAAAWLAVRVRGAVRRRGAARIALSGGSSPALMLVELARLDVPWGAVHVWQVDERVAPDGHADRNAPLLGVLPVKPRNVHLMPVTSRDLRGACRRYADGLPERFDVVHLGVGDDGHTASWAPGDPVIDSPRTVALTGEYRGRVRMTLTPGVVNAARQRLVLATGSSKAEAVRRWLLHDSTLPIERVRRTATTVLLDAAAAALLPAPR